MSEMYDKQLIADLDRIEIEVKKRKRANKPFAAWAMFERLEALKSFWERNTKQGACA